MHQLRNRHYTNDNFAKFKLKSRHAIGAQYHPDAALHPYIDSRMQREGPRPSRLRGSTPEQVALFARAMEQMRGGGSEAGIGANARNEAQVFGYAPASNAAQADALNETLVRRWDASSNVQEPQTMPATRERRRMLRVRRVCSEPQGMLMGADSSIQRAPNASSSDEHQVGSSFMDGAQMALQPTHVDSFSFQVAERALMFDLIENNNANPQTSAPPRAPGAPNVSTDFDDSLASVTALRRNGARVNWATRSASIPITSTSQEEASAMMRANYERMLRHRNARTGSVTQHGRVSDTPMLPTLYASQYPWNRPEGLNRGTSVVPQHTAGAGTSSHAARTRATMRRGVTAPLLTTDEESEEDENVNRLLEFSRNVAKSIDAVNRLEQKLVSKTTHASIMDGDFDLVRARVELAQLMEERLKVAGQWTRRLEEVMSKLDDAKKNSPEAEGPECVIDLTRIEAGDEVVRLPCMHVFHSECLMPYLHREDVPLCPIDRSPIPKRVIHRLPVWRWGNC